jgi:putative transposase
VVAEIPKTRFNGRSGSSGAGFDSANCRRAELEIISGKVARDPVHVFVGYRPNQDVSQIMQWLKGISSRVLLQEFPHLRKRFWGRHFWARGYLAVSSGNITDEMVKEYIEEQEGEQIIDDSRFPIDSL